MSRFAALLCLLSSFACGSKTIGGIVDDVGGAGGSAGSTEQKEASAGTSSDTNVGGAGGSSGSPDHLGAAGSAGQPAVTRALILVDGRLYQWIAQRLVTYRDAAAARRGFTIDIRAIDGIDDWTYGRVHQYLIEQREQNPNLQGVLFVGNIKVPSFYKIRGDFTTTAIYPLYYEDLDARWSRKQEPGSVDPLCTSPGQLKCRVGAEGEEFRVPAHDFDWVEFGDSYGPELWSAYMPVGDGLTDDYLTFASQLEPYLDKVIRYYRGEIKTDRRYYYVSNDPGEQLELAWQAFDPKLIDFYGKPPTSSAGCFVDGKNVCYQRNPLELYRDCAEFKATYPDWNAFGSFGEGWQEPDVFREHMNGATHQVVQVNVPGSATHAILNPEEIRALSRAGLIVALDHAEALGFRQPGSGSSVSSQTYVRDSLALGFLYGSSQAIAVLGSPHPRGSYANHPRIYFELKRPHSESYLGLAHRVRMSANYERIAGNAEQLRLHGAEMLLGDPFMDLQQ